MHHAGVANRRCIQVKIIVFCRRFVCKVNQVTQVLARKLYYPEKVLVKFIHLKK